MAAFRPVDPLFQHRDNQGAVLAGGTIEFYESGTNDAKSVYSDEALSVALGTSITLDSAGRLPSDIWGVGVYRIRLFSALETLIDEADPVQEEGGAGSAIPSQTGHSGKALFTNGSDMSWLDVEQLPDMTGQSGKYLTNDGTDASWETLTIPDLPADGIEQTTTEWRIGTLLCKVGTGTFPSSGTQASSVVVTFGGTAFSGAPVAVFVQMGPGASMYLHARVDSSTATTVNLSCDSNIIGELINATQSFTYLAIGPTTP